MEGTRTQKVTMFADAAQGHSARDRVINALKEKVYNVEEFYWEEGVAQAVAKDHHFQNITLFVIAMNTIWMAVETDYNKALVLSQAPIVFQIVDNLFTLYFMFEITVRFCAFKRKRNALNDGWFCFDSFLVLLMVWETYIVVFLFMLMSGISSGGLKKLVIFRLFRLLRLTRVARLARVLRAFPELLVLSKAMVMALRSLGATLSLLFIIIYVFSIMFTQLLGETEIGKGYFEKIPQTMNTLLMQGVFMDQRDFFDHLLSGSLTYYFLFMLFLLVATFTVLNMLIGVICEVISDVANREREDILVQDLRVKIGQISKIFAQTEEAPAEGERKVTRKCFEELMDHDEAARALKDVGVDVVALVDLADFIFPEKDEIEMSKFMQLILQFRGSNTATVKDIVDMRKYVMDELRELEWKLGDGTMHATQSR